MKREYPSGEAKFFGEAMALVCGKDVLILTFRLPWGLFTPPEIVKDWPAAYLRESLVTLEAIDDGALANYFSK